MAKRKRTPRDTDDSDGYKLSVPPEGDVWRSQSVMDQIKAKSQVRADADAFDAFVNCLTGIGDWTKDKTFGGSATGPRLQVSVLPGNECEDRWRGSDIGSNFVESVPDEMTRA